MAEKQYHFSRVAAVLGAMVGGIGMGMSLASMYYRHTYWRCSVASKAPNANADYDDIEETLTCVRNLFISGGLSVGVATLVN